MEQMWITKTKANLPNLHINLKSSGGNLPHIQFRSYWEKNSN
jgi:hypothetical protein